MTETHFNDDKESVLNTRVDTKYVNKIYDLCQIVVLPGFNGNHQAFSLLFCLDVTDPIRTQCTDARLEKVQRI